MIFRSSLVTLIVHKYSDHSDSILYLRYSLGFLFLETSKRFLEIPVILWITSKVAVKKSAIGILGNILGCVKILYVSRYFS